MTAVRVLWLVGLAALASGCALGARTATPAAPSAPPAETLETHIEKVRYLSSRPLVKEQSLTSVERQDRALAAALQQLEMAPSAARLRAVAERYRMLGVLDASYAHYNRAVKLDPRDAAGYDGLARIWRDWGLPAIALTDAHRAIFHAPRSAAAHNTLGTVFQALGQTANARQAYGRARTLDPGAAYATSNLCYLSFLEGDFERAGTLCQSALAVDPGFTAARHNLALVHAATGRLDLARRAFMDAGDEAVASFNMGIVHMAARNYATAAASFDAASRANPTMNVARERAQQARVFQRNAAREALRDQK